MARGDFDLKFKLEIRRSEIQNEGELLFNQILALSIKIIAPQNEETLRSKPKKYLWDSSICGETLKKFINPGITLETINT